MFRTPSRTAARIDTTDAPPATDVARVCPCPGPSPGRAAATAYPASCASTATRSLWVARTGANAGTRAGAATASARQAWMDLQMWLRTSRATRSRRRRRGWRQRHPVRHRAHLFRHRHLRDVEPVRRSGELPGRARWWTVSGGIDAVPRVSGRATWLHSRLPGSELPVRAAARRLRRRAQLRLPACRRLPTHHVCISAQGRDVLCANS